MKKYESEANWVERQSGPPVRVDGPGCTPYVVAGDQEQTGKSLTAAVGELLASVSTCMQLAEGADGTKYMCRKPLHHVSQGDPWHNLIPMAEGLEVSEMVYGIFSGAMPVPTDPEPGTTQ